MSSKHLGPADTLPVRPTIFVTSGLVGHRGDHLHFAHGVIGNGFLEQPEGIGEVICVDVCFV